MSVPAKEVTIIKDILKTIKLNEGTISMILGAVVVIVVGILVINYFRDLREDIGPKVSQPGAGTEKVTLPKQHTVAQNEHLWALAEKYYGSGYNWVDIARENNLKNPDRVLVGQILNIPDVEPRLVELPQTGIATTDGAISGDTYTVVKGDYLWDIAVRAYGDGYKWVEIARENAIPNPDIIEPGQELKLPR